MHANEAILPSHMGLRLQYSTYSETTTLHADNPKYEPQPLLIGLGSHVVVWNAHDGFKVPTTIFLSMSLPLDHLPGWSSP